MSTIALYHFDGNGNDDVGSFNFTPVGSITYQTGKFSQGLSFNSLLSSKLQINSTSNPFSNLGTIFTLEFFAKFTSGAQHLIQSSDSKINIATNGSGTLTFGFISGFYNYSVNISSFLDDGQFHHIALVKDGTFLKIYKDGVVSSSNSGVPDFMSSSVSDIIINNLSNMTTVLDEMRISNTAVYTTNFTVPTQPFSGGSTMATRLGLITIGGKRVIELDSSPSTGYDAPIGSMVLVNEGGVGRLYLKIGSANTAWDQVQSGAVDLTPYLKKDGTVAMTGNLNLNSNKIVGLANAVNSDEAVNKGQMDSALALKIDSSEKGVANGVATLGADGKLPSAQVPAIAITDIFVVASQSAMLALSTAEQGDVAVRTDLNKSFILVSGSYSVLSNWQELLTPTDTVLSVNGQTGVVVLTSSNIAEGSNLYFTEARVLATQLAGLSLASSASIADGDSVIVAFGKLQKQISDEVSARQSADSTLQNNIDNEATARINEDLTFLKLNGSRAMSANLDFGSFKGVNLADPTAFTDAVNKQYVDADGGQESIALDNTTKAMTKLKASLTDAGTNSNTKITLPAISSLQIGQTFIIVNHTSTSLNGAGGIYQSDGVTMIGTGFPAGHKGFFTLISKSPETWSSHFLILRSGSGYNFANRKLINVTDPTNAQDGATKSYVDGLFTAQGPVWKAPLSATGLNDATADMFFGSKSGDFNIKFYRNNEEFFSMTKALGVKKLVMSVDRIERSDANFAISAPNNVMATVGATRYDEASLFMKVPLFAGVVPVKLQEYEKGVDAEILNVEATKSVQYTSNSPNSNRRIKVKIMLTSDQGDMFLEKEVHINKSNALVITQDSFTSKESGVSAIECSMSFSAGVLSANLSGMASLTTKKVVMKCEEIVQVP